MNWITALICGFAVGVVLRLTVEALCEILSHAHKFEVTAARPADLTAPTTEEGQPYYLVVYREADPLIAEAFDLDAIPLIAWSDPITDPTIIRSITDPKT